MKINVGNLVQLLLEAKQAYYDGEPIITDFEFDEMEDKLRQADPENPYFDVVGAPERGVKVKHEVLMRSMQKCNTLEHVEKWYQRNEYAHNESMICMHKLDGLSGTLKYSSGSLIYVATRGDGSEGSDVTRHMNHIKGIPKHLGKNVDVEIRGEFVIPLSSHLNDGSTPIRSVTAGLVNRKESTEDLKEVHFVAYDILGLDFEGENDKMRMLLSFNFEIVAWVNCGLLKTVEEFYLGTIKHRANQTYELDGIIVKPNDCKLQAKLEDGNEHHPVWATAWKFPAEGKWTVLRDIEYETSRLGRLVPVAVFDPIIIGGSTITRCALNNQAQVEDQDIQINDRLYIEKANDIIPKLIRKESAKDRFPNYKSVRCGCGNNDLKREGVHLVCKDADCSLRIIGEITFWVKEIGIENFGDAAVKTLHAQGLLDSIDCLYYLTKENLEGIPGIGESKMTNILSELKRTKSMTEQEFLSKLGIPSVGLKALKKLGIESVQDFRIFNDPTYAIGRQIREWKSYQVNLDLLDNLVKVLDLQSQTNSKSVQQGKKVCATGKAPMKRDELVKLMEASGKYQWVDSVGKDTDLLVTDDPQGDSSKLVKAKKLGIQIMIYDDFLKELK